MRLRFALVLAAMAGGVAHADMGALPDGATIVLNKTLLHEVANDQTNGGVDLAEPLKLPDSLWRYFDYAHCVCDEPATRSATNPGTNAQDPNKHETTFAYELLLQNATNLNDLTFPVDIYTGTNCDVIGSGSGQQNLCTKEGSIPDLAAIVASGGTRPEIHVFDVMNAGLDPTTQQPFQTCAPNAGFTMGLVWLVASTMGGSTPDFSQTFQVTVDTFPPPLPANLQAQPGESAINLTWDMPTTGDISDIYTYQALCANEDGTPALPSPSSSPLYLTPRTLCGDPQDITWMSFTADTSSRRVPVAGFATDGGTDAPTDAPPDAAPDAGTGGDAGVVMTTPPIDGIAKLDPAFICGETTDATATSLRINGLTNGKKYYVALLVNDKFLNATGMFSTNTLTPQAVTDFWEDLHDRGSHVEGGFCLLAETYGDHSGPTNALRAFRDDDLAGSAAGRALIRAYYATLGKLGVYVHGSIALRVVALYATAPLVVVALLWHYLTLPGLLGLIALALLARRRRKVWLLRAATAATALAIFAPHAAHAQAQPYWERNDATDDGTTDETEPGNVGWHAGIRIGPYTPGIDAQLGGPSPGPYQQMFGKGGILPMLDVEKIVFHTMYGQIGFGGSIGFLRRSAKAFTDTSNPTDADRMRSSGDDNSFTLIPVQANATYRFTYLDDEYGIPIIPYARGGVAYYAWWITAPDGDFAQVCENGGVEPNCSQNKAAGASMGLVGSLGIAVRAERVQADAAATMRDGGIQHAGFYGEISSGWVNGFGSDTKLSVGATTWFAGVDFEF